MIRPLHPLSRSVEAVQFEDGEWIRISPNDRRLLYRNYREICGFAVKRQIVGRDWIAPQAPRWWRSDESPFDRWTRDHRQEYVVGRKSGRLIATGKREKQQKQEG